MSVVRAASRVSAARVAARRRRAPSPEASAQGWARRSRRRSPIRCRSRLPVVHASTASTAASSTSVGTSAACAVRTDDRRRGPGRRRPARPWPGARRPARCRSARAAGRARRRATATRGPPSGADPRGRAGALEDLAQRLVRPAADARAAAPRRSAPVTRRSGRPAPSAQAFRAATGPASTTRSSGRRRVAAPTSPARSSSQPRSSGPGGSPAPTRTAETSGRSASSVISRGSWLSGDAVADPPRRAGGHGLEQPDRAA